ncbi:unnamed protein product, partial [Polarella glacialis]
VLLCLLGFSSILISVGWLNPAAPGSMEELPTAQKPTQAPTKVLMSAATPQRQRTPGTAAPTEACPTPYCSQGDGEDGLPAEVKVRGSWPQTFVEGPRGERVELGEGGSLATRTSGLCQGIAFVGPLSLEKGVAYFEVEVAELEPNRSQTMAIGICCALPSVTGRSNCLRTERARDLEGSILIGYDLPKVYSSGKEVAKVETKKWRPLK